MTGTWVYGAIVALLVLHVIALRYAYRNGKRAASAGRDLDEYVSEAGVECPNCGEVNEVGYRYCRSCVDELPGSVSFLDAGPARRRRQAF